VVVPQNPDADVVCLDIVWKVVGKTFQVAAPQTAGIEMEKLRVRACLLDPDAELGEKIIRKLFRDGFIFPEDLVEIRLDAAVESSFHDA